MLFFTYNCCLLFLCYQIICSIERKGHYFDVNQENFRDCVRSLDRGGTQIQSVRLAGFLVPSNGNGGLLLLLQFFHLRNTKKQKIETIRASASNFGVIEGLAHSAERAPQKRKSITGLEQRT